MPEGREYAYGAGPGGGLGNKIGQIGSPLEVPPYSIEANGGGSQKGGEPCGPFGSYKETPNQMMGVSRDSMDGRPMEGFANLGGSQGRFSTPMDTSTAEMPGVRGSDGTGATGGAKISSPWAGPFGEMVG